MKIFVVDAFASERFMGNQAGVVILEEGVDYPCDERMTQLAAELKHSETAFVRRQGASAYQLRYFTPVGEVELCGHATVAAFTVLRETGLAAAGAYLARTLAGELNVTVEERFIWMDMAEPVQVYRFTIEEAAELYAACGMDLTAEPAGLMPEIIKAGLSDIQLPVKNKELLDQAVIDMARVSRLSERYQVTGIHMFCPGQDGIAAYCRNFAPLYEIPEEAATGTSNGGLTLYLRDHGLLRERQVNRFRQGEAMGRTSYVYTTISGAFVRVGGEAAVSLECRLFGC